MKKHLIKQIENKRGDAGSGYSIYKNPDPVLRKQIAEFKSEKNTITMGWPAVEWEIKKYVKDEVKCVRGKDVKYFPKAEVDEAITETLAYERNQKFQPHQYFKKHFGIVSYLWKAGNDITLVKLDLVKGYGMLGSDKPVDPLTVQVYDTAYSYEVNDYEGIILSVEEHPEMMNIYFDADGNYVNRNYNLNLNTYETKDIHQKVVLDFFEKRILSIGKLEFASGKYFNAKFCYIPFVDEKSVGVQRIPVRADKRSYQKQSGYPIYKKPSKTESKTAKELLNHLHELKPAEYWKRFEIAEVVPKEEKVGKPRRLNEKEIAKGRSSTYYQMSGQEQWDEDKRLGILDWDGN